MPNALTLFFDAFAVIFGGCLGFGVFLVVQDAWGQYVDPILFRGRKDA
jgi:hypothetical protein